VGARSATTEGPTAAPITSPTVQIATVAAYAGTLLAQAVAPKPRPTNTELTASTRDRG
jgi:hypothetical protein